MSVTKHTKSPAPNIIKMRLPNTYTIREDNCVRETIFLVFSFCVPDGADDKRHLTGTCLSMPAHVPFTFSPNPAAFGKTYTAVG